MIVLLCSDTAEQVLSMFVIVSKHEEIQVFFPNLKSKKQGGDCRPVAFPESSAPGLAHILHLVIRYLKVDMQPLCAHHK